MKEIIVWGTCEISVFTVVELEDHEPDEAALAIAENRVGPTVDYGYGYGGRTEYESWVTDEIDNLTFDLDIEK